VSVIVKAGEIDLDLDNGNTVVLPSGYGMVHDTTGEYLDKCSLFFGPIETTHRTPSEVPSDAREYFGNDYVVRIALIDVPEGKWKLVGHATEITYYRPGEHEGDWHHAFESPQPLFEHGGWLRVELPGDCEVTYRGIVRP